MVVVGTYCTVICQSKRIKLHLHKVCIQNTKFVKDWEIINPQCDNPVYSKTINGVECYVILSTNFDYMSSYPQTLSTHPLHEIMGKYSIVNWKHRVNEDCIPVELVDSKSTVFDEYRDDPLGVFLQDTKNYDYRIHRPFPDAAWRIVRIADKCIPYNFGTIDLDA